MSVTLASKAEDCVTISAIFLHRNQASPALARIQQRNSAYQRMCHTHNSIVNKPNNEEAEGLRTFPLQKAEMYSVYIRDDMSRNTNRSDLSASSTGPTRK